jgi:predicted Zn-dependent protease
MGSGKCPLLAFITPLFIASQLGLYHAVQNERTRAIQAFNKALFIHPEHVPATIHLCQMYLTPRSSASVPEPSEIDLAAGILADLTKGDAWDVAEAWYFLGKAHGLRGERARERECLCYALILSEGRSLRDLGEAVGWCL